MKIGHAIRKFRKSFSMDQKTLADKLNVSNKTISSWERNRTEPNMETIEKLCTIFQCSKSDFLDDDLDVSAVLNKYTIISNITSEPMVNAANRPSGESHPYSRFIASNPDFLETASKCTKEQLNAITKIMKLFCKQEKED